MILCLIIFINIFYYIKLKRFRSVIYIILYCLYLTVMKIY